MRFADFDQNELDKTELLPEGDYDFEVTKSELTVSKKSGNEMIALSLRVFARDGSTHFVNDHLVSMEKMKWKMIQVVKCLKVSAPIEADDLIGKCGRVTIKIEQGGEFPAKNAVKAYLEAEKAETQEAPATFKPSAPIENLEEKDDLPF